jgi:hypothetical protein
VLPIIVPSAMSRRRAAAVAAASAAAASASLGRGRLAEGAAVVAGDCDGRDDAGFDAAAGFVVATAFAAGFAGSVLVAIAGAVVRGVGVGDAAGR